MSYINEFPIARISATRPPAPAEDQAERLLLIDSRGTVVPGSAWSASRRASAGSLPTLIAWDKDVPPFPILAGDVADADAALPMRGCRIAA